MRKNVIDAINRLYTAAMAAVHETDRRGGGFGSIFTIWRIHVQDGKSGYECAAQGVEEDANQILNTLRDQAHEIDHLESQLRLTKLSKNTRAALKELEKDQKAAQKAKEDAQVSSTLVRKVQEELERVKETAKMFADQRDALIENLKKIESDRKQLEKRYADIRMECSQAMSDKINVEEERDAALVKVGSMTIELEKLRAEVELLRPKSPIGKARRKLDIQRTS